MIAIFVLFAPLVYARTKLAGNTIARKSRSCSEFLIGDQTPNADLESYVNILGGTDSRYDVSHGSTLPLITRPWGFNTFAPQTDDDPTWPGWWFHPSDRRFFGLRLTHQPSPWIADYGNFLIKAYMPSDPKDKTASRDGFTSFSPDKSVFSPHLFETTLYTYGNTNGNVKLQFTPSSHGGIFRAQFPTFIAQEVGDSNANAAQEQIRRFSIELPKNTDFSEVIVSPIDGTAMISGYTKANSGGVGSDSAAFAHYFVAAVYLGKNGDMKTSVNAASFQAGGNKAWLDFAPEDVNTEMLTIKIATSFISKDQAIQNLKNELLSASFDSLLSEAKEEWRSVLGRVKITEAPKGYNQCQLEDLYTIFYSTLYRSSIFPRIISEVDADNKEVHWSPYAQSADTRVADGPLSTDSGFWDAWNTVYPLLSLVNRPMLGRTMQGWVNAYKEGGWLPKWASPGYRGSMIGTMGDVSLADAIVKDIPNFDVEKAYEAIRKDAFELPPKGVDGIGRVCLDSYLKYGYVPRGAPMTTGGTCYEVVSRTLNYLQSDYAVAQAAIKLGYKDDATTLQQRYNNFTLLFDQSTGFFRSKAIENEKWTEPFDQFGWGNDYTESGPWQYRFYLPYDAKGLSSLYAAGGRNMCEELQKAQTMEVSSVHIGGYGSVIHEQTEMPDHCWGQYAHNNQPVHHMLYMHMMDGYTGQCSNQGRHWIRKVLTELYSTGADMYPGDEDNGEMAAWFVLSSIGLYNRSPGGTGYDLGSPLFGTVELDISDNSHLTGKQSKRTLKIVAKNNSYANTYVQKIMWNDKELDESADSIDYSLLSQGGTLTFEMGPVPK